MARGSKAPGRPAGFGAAQQGYGQQAATAAALKAVPMANGPAAPTGAGPGGAPTAPGAPPEVGFTPSTSPQLDHPSMRPDEPITSGASFGPGMGMGQLSLPNPPQQQQDKVDSELFAKYLPSLEAVASEPNSSPALRSFVRRMRAMLPMDYDPTSGQP